MRQLLTLERITLWQRLAIGLLLFASGLPVKSLEQYADYDFQGDSNNNTTLIVFIAGLGGEKSWKKMAQLMGSEPEFNNIDYLAYHSPQSLDIEENIQRALTILKNYSSNYAETIFVGHSIGGIMIKRMLLRETTKNPGTSRLPNMVITFGTPFDTDKFTVSLFKRLGARIFWTTVPPLSREVFDLETLKEINSDWRKAANTSPINQIKQINIFGVQDETAPARFEGRSKDTVFITGDHLGIITPESKQACSWIVFKSVVLDRATDPRKLDCVLPIPSGADSLDTS
jgi:hypothetical protein